MFFHAPTFAKIMNGIAAFPPPARILGGQKIRPRSLLFLFAFPRRKNLGKRKRAWPDFAAESARRRGGLPVRAGRRAERKIRAQATTHAERATSFGIVAKMGSSVVVHSHNFVKYCMMRKRTLSSVGRAIHLH